MATNAAWTVVMDDKKILNHSVNKVGTLIKEQPIRN